MNDCVSWGKGCARVCQDQVVKKWEIKNKTKAIL